MPTPPPPTGPAGLHDIRETNLGSVLRAIREGAPCSRAEVAAATGLTKATVSSIVTELIDRGLVRESGATAERRVGRPGVMLSLDDRGFVALGLEVNVDYLTLVAVDLLEREVVALHEPFAARDAGPEECAARLADLALRALEEPSLAGRALLGVGVAVPGMIDAAEGRVYDAPNLGWRNVPLRAWLRELLRKGGTPDVPVLVDNDANLGAVAEYRGGHLSHTPDLVYITGEVGIGAGVLVGGALLRGSTGQAGEIGHIPLRRGGPRCGCGRRGCLESLAGIDAILRQTVPDLVPAGPLPGTDLAAAVAATVERAQEGRGAVQRALRRSGTWLGRGVATLANLVDPDVVILGGYFAPLAPWLLPACRAAVQAHAIAPRRGGLRVEVSELGLTAAARGGAAALIEALDTGRTPPPSPASR
ncbi:ROK family protein [Marinactinospora thermotolerans]|uniref:Sugar kinase of the NBD/HSP70 family, may contain an N-terminal HTH domain n=1 Tax=Marinactinospora thermotolerans DSM 45154 TaxID=1122192 RepID=A0A1T4SZE0_9ACTN|nr:ROK family transcriptional regulator [Marinactinospora thermotolerans]SKA33586.1 Sugar kinase of the NBD/HSP70 family, may contain an N-terminal HTH domain [Marinactinospora thermotolerans DSM 45154]